MSDADLKREISAVFQPIYGKLANTYRGLFSPADTKKAAEHCMFWISELAAAGLNGDAVIKTAQMIEKSEKFISKPPTPIEFISIARRLELTNGSEMSETDAFFYPIYQKMGERYKYLWDKESNSTASTSYIFWRDEIKKLGVSRSGVEKVFNIIPSIPEYITYPPSINEVILMLKIVHANKNIPFVHEAMREALEKKDNAHPLVKCARYQFGGQELRKADKSKIRTEFGKIYASVVVDYLDGRLDISPFEEKSSEKDDTPSLSKEDVLKKLDELLNSL